MLRRCRNPNATDFRRYGACGIAVCDEWQNSFAKFKEWSIENGYSDELSLDRIKSSLGYSPDNCRWATTTEQARNVRKQTRKLTSKYKGVCWSENRKKWILQVGMPGRSSYRGAFADEVEAAKEYDRIVKEEFGLFAVTNFNENGELNV